MFKTSVMTVGVAMITALCAALTTGCFGDDAEVDAPDIATDARETEVQETEDLLCGDGPPRDGDSGDAHIRLRPQNNAAEDFENLQWAVDNVVGGGTVELCEGTFFLGDGVSSQRLSVTIQRGLRMIGKKSSGEWLTIVKGGGSPGPSPPDPDIGPVLVSNTQDPNPSVFEKIWFREWTSETIYINGCKSFTLKDSRISHPVLARPQGSALFIHAIWTTGPKANGDFVVENNLVELGSYGDGELPSDEQLLGVFSPSHDNIRIVGNTITGIDEALELINNTPPNGSWDIVIEGNTIDVSFGVAPGWIGQWAMLVANNQNTQQVRIQDNVMNLKGPGTALGLTGENFLVKGNEVHLEPLDGLKPQSAIQVGNVGSFGGMELGTSMNNSVIEGNEFDGSVEDVVISFVEGENASHDNIFRLGESVAAVDAPVTIRVSSGACNNTFEGNTGIVEDASASGCTTIGK